MRAPAISQHILNEHITINLREIGFQETQPET
jgi:hypothetical protein